MEQAQQTAIQARVFDFALRELVHSTRDSFQPLWTIDSWVKFLIWLALNCGLSGEKESLELFAETLGAPLTRRMRKIFFERVLDNPSICLIADPAESHVLLMPGSGGVKITFEDAYAALKILGLMETVDVDKSTWNMNEGIISISWKSSEKKL